MYTHAHIYSVFSTHNYDQIAKLALEAERKEKEYIHNEGRLKLWSCDVNYILVAGYSVILKQKWVSSYRSSCVLANSGGLNISIIGFG